MQRHAEHLGLISLAYFGLSHGPPQRLGCLHAMAGHTEDQAAVIPPAPDTKEELSPEPELELTTI